jgi:hypothetical protein
VVIPGQTEQMFLSTVARLFGSVSRDVDNRAPFALHGGKVAD